MLRNVCKEGGKIGYKQKGKKEKDKKNGIETNSFQLSNNEAMIRLSFGVFFSVLFVFFWRW